MARPAHRRALILEPSVITRQVLKRLLRRHGFERVLEAESAQDALMLIRAEPAGLILTAWAPSGMEGIALLRALKGPIPGRPPRNPPPAIVLLDGGLSQQQVVAAVKAGIAGRLAIPPQAHQLAEILGTIAEPTPQSRRLAEPPEATPSQF